MSTADQANEKSEEPAGLVCQTCGCRHFYVIYTRRQFGKIFRRRECRHCGRRISTREKEVGRE